MKNENGWTRGVTNNPQAIGGIEIEVTYSGQKGLKHIFHVYGKNNDGDIVMDLLEEHKPNEVVKKYGLLDRRVVVDEKWFTHEPKRLIKLM